MSISKIPTIKALKGPTMTDYKSAAAASRGDKLKTMGFAGGGPVIQPASFPMRPPVVAPLRSIAPPIGVKRPSVPGLAVGGNVGGHPVSVTRGPAAEREMARMEREAKAEQKARSTGTQRQKKG
jgi:hypothetical protein